VGVLHFNQNELKGVCYRAVFSLLVAGIILNLAYADEKPHNPNKTGAEKNMPIHITADRLISDKNAGYAEFIGNVKAVQKETVITADRLKIFFKKNLDNKGPISVNEESIHEIVAKGDVKIKFDNRLAVTEQAVYNTDTMVLVLTGDNSKIISENDSISGEKITLYRTDGRINVESGNKKRVEAVFYSGQQDKK